MSKRPSSGTTQPVAMRVGRPTVDYQTHIALSSHAINVSFVVRPWVSALVSFIGPRNSLLHRLVIPVKLFVCVLAYGASTSLKKRVPLAKRDLSHTHDASPSFSLCHSDSTVILSPRFPVSLCSLSYLTINAKAKWIRVATFAGTGRQRLPRRRELTDGDYAGIPVRVRSSRS